MLVHVVQSQAACMFGANAHDMTMCAIRKAHTHTQTYIYTARSNTACIFLQLYTCLHVSQRHEPRSFCQVSLQKAPTRATSCLTRRLEHKTFKCGASRLERGTKHALAYLNDAGLVGSVLDSELLGPLHLGLGGDAVLLRATMTAASDSQQQGEDTEMDDLFGSERLECFKHYLSQLEVVNVRLLRD
jgi:hypothetical protein